MVGTSAITPTKKMSKRPEMRRDGTTFVPRVRVPPIFFREQAARQGYFRKAKNNERKLSYEK